MKELCPDQGAPVPPEPTDEELLRLAASAIEPYESCGIALNEYEAESEAAVEVYGSELIAFARAVLARWGNTTPQPVPVSERLPGPEDCDAEGRCWRFAPAEGFGAAGWSFYQGSEDDTHWLPAHALPIPGDNQQ